MPTPRNLIALALIVGVAGHFALTDYFHRTLETMRDRDRDRGAVLTKYAADAEAKRRGEAQKEAFQRREDQQKKIRAALGESYDAIVKDPSLSLPEMLHEIARTAAPEGAKVIVAVDRFTEFEVGIELPAPLTMPELAAVAHPIVEHAAPYLSRLCFFIQNKLAAELDDQALSALRRSKLAPVAQIENLLAVSVVGDSGTASPSGQTSVPGKAPNPMVGKYKAIVEGWYRDSDSHMQALNDAMRKISQSVTLSGMKSKADLTPRLDLVEQAGREILEAQEFFPGALAALRQSLSQGDFDPVLVKITMRNADAFSSARLAPLLNFVTRLTRHQANAQEMLRDLRDRSAEWRINAAGKIEFTAPAALASFQTHVGAVTQSGAEVDAAARSVVAKPQPR